MARGEIQWYEGADAPDASADTTIPDEPRAAAGGPIVTTDGLDEGHSFGVPERPANAVSEPSRGKSSPISGPMDE